MDASHDDPLTVNSFTLLRMEGVGVPPYSCRGAKQDLSPIDAATNLKRTVNGALVDISFTGFRKYKTTISCSDQVAPNFNGKWPGLTVVVDCISELGYTTVGGAPEREVVPGSSRVEGFHTYYRPRLTMKIMSLSTSTDEYDAACDWSIDLEEI